MTYSIKKIHRKSTNKQNKKITHSKLRYLKNKQAWTQHFHTHTIDTSRAERAIISVNSQSSIEGRKNAINKPYRIQPV